MIYKYLLIVAVVHASLEPEIAQLQSLISSEINSKTIKTIKQIIYLTNQELIIGGTNNEIETIYALLYKADQRLGTDLVDELQFSTNRGRLQIIMAQLRSALINQSFAELEGLMHTVTDEIRSLGRLHHDDRIQVEVNFVFSRCEEAIARHKISHDHFRARIYGINIQLQEWLMNFKHFTNKDLQELDKIVLYINKAISLNGTSREIEIAYQQILLLWERLKSNNPCDRLYDPTKYIGFKSRVINPEFAHFLDALRHWMAHEKYDAMDCLISNAKDAFQALPFDEQKILFVEAYTVFKMAESCIPR